MVDKEINEQIRKIAYENLRSYPIILKKHYPELIKYINQNTPLLQDKKYKLSTKIYWVLNGITEFPRCAVCNKEITGNIRSLVEGYHRLSLCKKKDGLNFHCGNSCAFKDEQTKQTQIETKIERYGDPYYTNHEKAEETNLQKYGVKNPFASEIIKEEIYRTNIEKYGEKNPFAFGSKRFKENFKNKYGVESASQVHEIQSKKSIGYRYDGNVFNSMDEMCYYIWLKEHNFSFVFHPKTYLLYKDTNDKEHKYYPDFLVNNELQEIKGDQFFINNEPITHCYGGYSWKEKYQCILDNNVKILRSADTKQYIEYVVSKYGKTFCKEHKIVNKKHENK